MQIPNWGALNLKHETINRSFQIEFQSLMGTVRHLLTRFRNAVSNSVRPFSSSAAVIRQPWTHCTDESEDSDGKSALYKRALKLQRPTTIRYKEYLHNSVSLIGTIGLPLRACKYPKFGLHTNLRVNPSSTGAYGGLWWAFPFCSVYRFVIFNYLLRNVNITG